MDDLKDFAENAVWHSEPPGWGVVGDSLSVTTRMKTDFWQDTFYGFHRDDGHFLGREVTRDFSAVVTFEADYEVLYDQAGAMLRLDAQNWVKSGIEYSDGVTNFSTVVTRAGRSDWSVIAVEGLLGPQIVRLTRVGNAVLTHFQAKDDGWRLMRLADFPKSETASVGVMACSPERAGLVARFHNVQIGAPVETPLHGD